MTNVVNLNRDRYDVYIGRGSKWGNPYSHKNGTLAIYKVTSRSVAISSYEQYILENTELLSSLDELVGKTLGCFCKRQNGTNDCHGDILKRLADLLEESGVSDPQELSVLYKQKYYSKKSTIDLF